MSNLKHYQTTDDVEQQAAHGGPPQQPPRKGHKLLVALLILAGMVIGIIAVSISDHAANSGSPTPDVTVQMHQPSPNMSPPGYDTGGSSQPSAAPAAPAFTVEQEQAITSAQNYIDSGMGFSKAGLYDQLTSSAGAGFSPKLARFALRHIDVNWNEQAVISAKNYLDSGMGFSYGSLVEQLSSPYGAQFTLAQAEHGATVAFQR